MNPRAKWGLVVAVVLVMGYMVYASVARVEKTCEVCVEFNDGRRCARGAGATEREAKQGAQTAACGVLASGMDESIRCQNTPPATATCTN